MILHTELPFLKPHDLETQYPVYHTTKSQKLRRTHLNPSGTIREINPAHQNQIFTSSLPSPKHFYLESLVEDTTLSIIVEAWLKLYRRTSVQKCPTDEGSMTRGFLAIRSHLLSLRLLWFPLLSFIPLMRISRTHTAEVISEHASGLCCCKQGDVKMR